MILFLGEIVNFEILRRIALNQIIEVLYYFYFVNIRFPQDESVLTLSTKVVHLV
jgi:hypothetical protein